MVSKDRGYIISAGSIRDIMTSSHSALPKEASGLLLGEGSAGSVILTVRNTTYDENTLVSFRISDKTIRSTEQSIAWTKLKIYGCFHSHVLGIARPSKRDCASPKRTGDLWMIYSVRYRQLKLFEWDGSAFQKRRFRVAK